MRKRLKLAAAAFAFAFASVGAAAALDIADIVKLLRRTVDEAMITEIILDCKLDAPPTAEEFRTLAASAATPELFALMANPVAYGDSSRQTGYYLVYLSGAVTKVNCAMGRCPVEDVFFLDTDEPVQYVTTEPEIIGGDVYYVYPETTYYYEDYSFPVYGNFPPAPPHHRPQIRPPHRPGRPQHRPNRPSHRPGRPGRPDRPDRPDRPKPVKPAPGEGPPPPPPPPAAPASPPPRAVIPAPARPAPPSTPSERPRPPSGGRSRSGERQERPRRPARESQKPDSPAQRPERPKPPADAPRVERRRESPVVPQQKAPPSEENRRQRRGNIGAKR